MPEPDHTPLPVGVDEVESSGGAKLVELGEIAQTVAAALEVGDLGALMQISFPETATRLGLAAARTDRRGVGPVILDRWWEDQTDDTGLFWAQVAWSNASNTFEGSLWFTHDGDRWLLDSPTDGAVEGDGLTVLLPDFADASGSPVTTGGNRMADIAGAEVMAGYHEVGLPTELGTWLELATTEPLRLDSIPELRADSAVIERAIEHATDVISESLAINHGDLRCGWTANSRVGEIEVGGVSQEPLVGCQRTWNTDADTDSLNFWRPELSDVQVVYVGQGTHRLTVTLAASGGRAVLEFHEHCRGRHCNTEWLTTFQVVDVNFLITNGDLRLSSVPEGGVFSVVAHSQ
jgi:hypothetical protein